MKKLFFFVLCLLGLGSFSFADEIIEIPSSYFVVSVSDYSSSYVAYKALDGITLNGPYSWIASDCSSGLWLRVQLPYPIKVWKYAISAEGNDPSHRFPKDFCFQGSNNGTSFVNLDCRTNQTFSGRDFNTYTYTPTTNYLYYRVYITDFAVGCDYGGIGELKLYRQDFDGTQLTGSYLPVFSSSVATEGFYTLVFSGSYEISQTSSSTFRYSPLGCNGTSFSGVNIHRKSSENGGTWVDFYNKTDLYLDGQYIKNYTGGGSNFWNLVPQIVYPIGSGFQGFVTGWINTQITGNQIYSGNQFEGFYTQGLKYVVSNYPTIILVLFGGMLILLLLRILFRKR